MNRLVERDGDRGHLTWSRAESSEGCSFWALFLRREQYQEAQSECQKTREKKDVKIIAESFQTANIISKVWLIAAITSMVSFHRWPSVISVISFISIFNAINILVSPLKFGFIHLLKVWHHDEPCKNGNRLKNVWKHFPFGPGVGISLINYLQRPITEARKNACKIEGCVWSSGWNPASLNILWSISGPQTSSLWYSRALCCIT